MARHKRERPPWLPKSIPYKDGRVLGLAKQTNLAWISAILAVTFFTLTVSYATEKSRFTSVKFVHSSRSNSILVLRVLSEITSVFLGATIHSTFEVVQWVLISRPDGIRLPQFLSLQSSTGPLGLLVLALGRGLPYSQWSIKPRLMSLLRLLAEIAIPVIAVLIMSNVNIDTVYLPIERTVQPFAMGMEPFNASVASELGVMEDLLFNIDYVYFLENPQHSLGISPEADGCTRGMAMSSNKSCSRRVLMTQAKQMVDANLNFDTSLNSEIVLSNNQQVYLLEYLDNIPVSSQDLECQRINSGPACYTLCTREAKAGLIEATLKICPPELVVKNNCLNDTTWEASPGFTTTIRASFLNASVSYNRLDGRILDHKIASEPILTCNNASELLRAMTIVLNTTMPAQSSLWSPILGAPTHFFGRLFAGQMYRIGKLMAVDPSARIKGVNALQNILAMTLFYCQNGVLSQTVLAQTVWPIAPNKTTTTLPQYHRGLFSGQDKTATVALAETRYRVNVGRATLMAYVVLSGVALTICIVVLVIGSLCELAKLDAEPTLWPALDFWTQCRVEDGNGTLVHSQKRAQLAWTQGQELFRELGGLRVTRRKRKLGDRLGMELPGLERGQDGVSASRGFGADTASENEEDSVRSKEDLGIPVH
ncbi:hypothetical protein BCR34DRAFT_598035 [Clohesyomyces aquaticus]|uniref:Uncharacterized protein n=1 Tax=Clohesyomyces aquaticus TaxID=1231657 RepID=A0A1Y2A0E8_9PLEO|nr:hypothetical protein BCR34DRAFT_598035 [Clohesyomyces aquaticus]